MARHVAVAPRRLALAVVATGVSAPGTAAAPAATAEQPDIAPAGAAREECQEKAREEEQEGRRSRAHAKMPFNQVVPAPGAQQAARRRPDAAIAGPPWLPAVGIQGHLAGLVPGKTLGVLGQVAARGARRLVAPAQTLQGAEAFDARVLLER